MEIAQDAFLRIRPKVDENIPIIFEPTSKQFLKAAPSFSSVSSKENPLFALRVYFPFSVIGKSIEEDG